MARVAGRSGRLYVSLTSGGSAEPINYLSSWSINFGTDNIEVTSMGDTHKVYLSLIHI